MNGIEKAWWFSEGVLALIVENSCGTRSLLESRNCCVLLVLMVLVVPAQNPDVTRNFGTPPFIGSSTNKKARTGAGLKELSRRHAEFRLITSCLTRSSA